MSLKISLFFQNLSSWSPNTYSLNLLFQGFILIGFSYLKMALWTIRNSRSNLKPFLSLKRSRLNSSRSTNSSSIGWTFLWHFCIGFNFRFIAGLLSDVSNFHENNSVRVKMTSFLFYGLSCSSLKCYYLWKYVIGRYKNGS